MKLFIDADACPVKDELRKLAKKYDLSLTFVASYNHFSINLPPGEEWIFVDTDKESADIRILNLAKSGDIVVTQDIGLASMLIAKDVAAFSNRGEEYRESEMAMMLDMRYLHAKERRQGKYSKGPRAMSFQDNENFLQRLDTFIEARLY
ncbi:YaiI/YqxD family protein [Listeria grandensis]|uniref:YaiI/YqxD family protein n=1 Tax=Listeria grandensis TaxID=1494963 RepID=UPI00164DC9F0|nr:YaiI/YqxD family protein [Listeria grandensis]MBC6315348.1 YaiI/YqxD family protein [Listeria grandensis]